MTKTFYKLMLINSADLIIPRDTCQRNLKIGRAKRIALEFNEYIASLTEAVELTLNDAAVKCHTPHLFVLG